MNYNTIYCNCKNGWGSRCGCKKSGCNVLQLVANIMGKLVSMLCTFDPEILQDSMTNILDDENNEKELEIFEGLENNEEEEEKINIYVRLIIKIFLKPLHIRISIVIIV
ncbi:hypothetical protein TNIN_324611 [Trichonephila inaurata madagascariensis]|uniref:Uncharacterized protein n=1 Tax=Trichonephila inaurata madagascariensis TaxID=2747483 RepID=A0A8X7C805_9ARAC|nr:hypothetical protein TNIN_324611 [Trichonephila inaurata madagascariensis]